MHGDDILDDVSAAAEAEDTIQALTSCSRANAAVDAVGSWSSSGHNRPSTAPPKRFQHASRGVDGVQNAMAGLDSLKAPLARPTSAKPRPAVSSGGNDSRCLSAAGGSTATSRGQGDSKAFRPVSAPSNRSLSASKLYLKKAAKDKRAREREFAMELFQEKADYERKVALKIGQANKLMRRHNIPKVYSQTKNRDNFLLVKVVEGPGDHERIMTADAFLTDFEKVATNLAYPRPSDGNNAAPTAPDNNSGTSSKQVKLRMQSKKDIQDGLRLVLKSTIELTAILEEQLFELQRKGWNCSANHPVSPHTDS